MNPKTPRRIWLLAGASSIALAVMLVSLSTRPVQADAALSRTAAATSAASVTSATPSSLAPQTSAAAQRTEKLSGVASWYGGVFNGRLTASGERFNKYAMTACHPTLPFGTIVRVVNLENNKSVVVRITDRGYLYDGRILDLSYGAARKIAMIKPGLAKVKLEVISMNETPGRK
jgi:rare lipoprotein A